jgi:hypothetical protein
MTVPDTWGPCAHCFPLAFGHVNKDFFLKAMVKDLKAAQDDTKDKDHGKSLINAALQTQIN